MLPRVIVSQFEFDLSPEVVRDLAVAGHTFRRELKVDGGAGEMVEQVEGSVAGLPRHAVTLEKFSDAIIKLFVTVYKLDASDIAASTQTDVQTNETRPTQTDILIQRDCDVQTPITSFLDSDAQTEDKVTSEGQIQTEPSVRNVRSQTMVRDIKECDMQTDIHAFKETDTQTERVVTEVMCQTRESRVHQRFRDVECSAVVAMRGIRLQAAPTMAWVESQTENFTTEAGVQAEPVGWENFCQTDMSMALQADGTVQATAEVVELATQTVTLPLADTLTQTTLCMLSTHHRASQAVAGSEEAVAQTEVSMALQSDAGVQMSATLGDGVTQTELYIEVEQVTQTDVSFYRQVEAETQFSPVEVLEQESQAVVFTQEFTTQTGTALETGLTQASQAVVLTQEFTTQTRSALETGCTQESQAVVSTQDAPSQTTQDAGQTHADIPLDALALSSQESLAMTSFAAGDLDSSFDTSLAGFSEVATPVRLRRPGTGASMRDGTAQTDPVTIIIGDASFLVKKLKSSAINPSKVTTSGNEIEIELSADTPGDMGGGMLSPQTYPFPPDTQPYPHYGNEGSAEKENNTATHPPGRISAVPSAGGVTRRGGGVVGAPTAGPRVREPAVQATYQQAPQGGAQRYRAPPAPRQEAPPVPVQLLGPAPVAGATLSCPFCTLTFVDSPALYEHLSMNHTVDQKTKWRQPRGREGRTIIGTRGGKSASPAPRGSSSATYSAAIPYAPPQQGEQEPEQEQEGGEFEEGTGLFEYPVEQPESVVVKKPRRGRLSTRGGGAAAGGTGGEDSDEGGRVDLAPPPAKRQHVEAEIKEEGRRPAGRGVTVRGGRGGGRRGK